MPRARNIKPAFFANDTLAELAPLVRLLFVGLWTIADRSGRLEDRPARIKAEVLPYDSCKADEMLGELADGGFIVRYVANNIKYIQVVNFSKHQNPHKNEAISTIPEPCLNRACTVQIEIKTERIALIPDSLNSDSGLPSGDVEINGDSVDKSVENFKGVGNVFPKIKGTNRSNPEARPGETTEQFETRKRHERRAPT